MQRKKIVLLGGGTGASTILKGLKYFPVDITAVITVSDNGAGIDKEDLPHIFERFYKGKNSSGSSVGIGLALARMIVVAQEGSLSATNGANGGARFEIRFYKGTV